MLTWQLAFDIIQYGHGEFMLSYVMAKEISACVFLLLVATEGYKTQSGFRKHAPSRLGQIRLSQIELSKRDNISIIIRDKRKQWNSILHSHIYDMQQFVYSERERDSIFENVWKCIYILKLYWSHSCLDFLYSLLYNF